MLSLTGHHLAPGVSCPVSSVSPRSLLLVLIPGLLTCHYPSVQSSAQSPLLGSTH